LNQPIPYEGERPDLPWLRVAEEELEALYSLAGVTNAILARRDGLSLAAIPYGRPTEKRLAAMLAALLGTSNMAVQEADGGAFQEALLRSERNEILCVSISEDVVLGVVAEKGALTGLLFLAIESAAKKIRNALAGA
jgi:predicted regulator of Ras-like GTPase activity (Roadblock/LC7/MglB family)